jgi:hypothetical protein
MGDRANVKVNDWNGLPTHFYTHWRGTELPVTVRNALTRRERWGDHAYLARMIFSEMIHGEETGSTGYGISASIADGDRRIIEVDPTNQIVSMGPRSWTFQEFAALPDDACRWPNGLDDE